MVSFEQRGYVLELHVQSGQYSSYPLWSSVVTQWEMIEADKPTPLCVEAPEFRASRDAAVAANLLRPDQKYSEENCDP